MVMVGVALLRIHQKLVPSHHVRSSLTSEGKKTFWAGMLKEKLAFPDPRPGPPPIMTAQRRRQLPHYHSTHTAHPGVTGNQGTSLRTTLDVGLVLGPSSWLCWVTCSMFHQFDSP